MSQKHHSQCTHPFSLLLAAMFLLILIGAAHAEVQVTESIHTSTRWTVYQSPYIVSQDLIIDAGATLTIDPGVSVYFTRGPMSKVVIEGVLIAHGQPSAEIYFGPDPEDPVSGSRLEDGSLKTKPFYGQGATWTGLVFSNNLDRSVLRYVILDSAVTGIRVDNSIVDIENSAIEDCATGIVVQGRNAVLNLQHSELSGNNIGLDAFDSARPAIINNTFRGNRIGIINNGAGPIIAPNIFSENEEDSVSQN